MEFSRQEYWSGLPFPSPGDLPDLRIEPFPSPGDLPDLRIEPESFTCLADMWQADSLLLRPPGKPHV